jgi:predicted HicB family RNase H-like nuclease
MTSKDEQIDNLDAAMAKVAEGITPTRKKNTGSAPGEPAQKQVIVRVTDADHEIWKSSAEKSGMSMAEFIRLAVNDACVKAGDCQHPVESRKNYPWATFCLSCNKRLSG